MKDSGHELPDKIMELFIPHSNEETNVREQKSTEEYFKAIGLRWDDLIRLRVVHIAGTKGKGSTCVMVENILRRCGYSTGLFTSPHLCDVCERIRINGRKIEWGRLLSEVEWVHSRLLNLQSESIPMPRFFRLMTFVCFRIFIQERLDVVILETGVGGRLDPTNFIPEPLVCGISSIGFDHMEILGHSLKEIAWEKAGILKPSCQAFTVPQFKEAMEVLDQKASEVGIQLTKIDQFAPFRNFAEIKNPLITTGFQSINARLAIHLARAFENLSWRFSVNSKLKDRHTRYHKRMRIFQKNHELPQEYVDALSDFEWPGRAQIILDEDCQNLRFYLDGAHTNESLAVCLNWFSSATKSTSQDSNTLNFLLFHSLREKSLESLLESLYKKMKSGKVVFDHVFFAPLLSSRFGKTPIRRHPNDCSYEKKHLTAWKSILTQDKILQQIPRQEIMKSSLKSDFLSFENDHVGSGKINADIFPSLHTALGWFRNFARENQKSEIRVLITGSLYLIGDMLKLLRKAPK